MELESQQGFTRGDLVCAYLMNSSYEVSLIQRGIVIDVNKLTKDVLVVDNNGYARWYPSSRWTSCDKED